MYENAGRNSHIHGDTKPAVWFPAIRAGTGADVFTERLAAGLERAGIRVEITWFPHYTEFAPWLVAVQQPPAWANIIHVNSWFHPRCIQLRSLPVVVTCHGCVHDSVLLPHKSFLQALYHRFWVRRVEGMEFRGGAAITAVSEYTAKKIKQMFTISEVKVVPNWIPDESFDYRDRSSPEPIFRLLYIGSWSRRKGADLLVEIMRGLGDGFELHFTGFPPSRAELPSNMKPLGWTTDSAVVRGWISSSDALLFPSRMEGMPLAVLEAMACGVPVIASDAASLPEIVQDGVNGFICAVDSPIEFIDAVRRMKNQSHWWAQARLAAHEAVRQRHSEHSAVQAYLEVYEAVLGAQSAQEGVA